MENALSTAHRCLYCGRETLIRPQKKELPSSFGELLLSHIEDLLPSAPPAQQYSCSTCGLIITQEDLENEAERLNRQEFYQGAGNPDDNLTEEKVLQAAERLLKQTLVHKKSDKEETESSKSQRCDLQKQNCEEAFGLLFQHGYPFQHPLEFMIYRDLSLAGRWLVCGRHEINSRYQHFDKMINNIRHLDYYLPQNDPEALYKTLSRIFRALMILGDMTGYCHTEYEYIVSNKRIPNNHIIFADETGRRRAAVLGLFADRLEELQNAPQGVQYLKMALQLWHKVLEQAEETYLYIKLGIGGDRYRRIPYEMQKQVVAKIQQLNKIIKQRDPNFAPPALPPLPLSPSWYDWAVCAVLSTLVIGPIFIFYFMDKLPFGFTFISDCILYLFTFGSDDPNIAMLMIVIYGILGVILHYAFIKPKLLPAIYNYLSTKREDQHK